MIKENQSMENCLQKFFFIVVMGIFVFLFSACIVDTDEDSDEEQQKIESEADEVDDDEDDDDQETVDYTYEISDSTNLYINLSEGTWSADNQIYNKITTTKYGAVTGVTIKFKTDSNKKNTNVILINATAAENPINYYFSGALSSGGLKIKTNAAIENSAVINLNGISINSSNYPCLAITEGASAVININGTNTFVDGRIYGTGYGEDYSGVSENYCSADGSDNKGTLFCKGNLVLNGSGSLSIETNYKNCIAAGTDTNTASLTINNGTYSLSSTGKSGLNAQNVIINDGSYSFTGRGTVSTSEFHKTHGISSNGDIVINGGKLNFTVYNGKGISGDTVKISGGKISMDVSGVTNFTSDNRKTGTYYDADGIKQSNQTIVFAAEGIEGASNITISGGEIEITAVDDAINLSSTGKNVNITGGSIYVYSSGGDGIDSNGNIKISGGVVMTCAPTGSEDGLDCGDGSYSITITGGLVGSCSGASNASAPSVSGQKAFVLGGRSSGFGGGNRPGSTTQTSSSYSGKTIVVLDSSSNVIYTLTVPSVSTSASSGIRGGSDYSNIMITSPLFKTSGSYSVYTGATVTGGENFHGLYTTVPTVSSIGSSVSVSSY